MASDRECDDIAFVKEGLASLANRRLILPALLLATSLAVGKIGLLSYLPTARNPDHLPYLLAFMLMLLASLAVVVAMLRILNASARPPWQPDSSLWLYAMVFVGGAFIGLMADLVVGGRNDHPSGLAAASLSSALWALLAPWFVAIAVEHTLAWQPGPWLRQFRAWLPSLLLWALLILVPLRHLQLMLNWRFLVSGTDWFWPAVLVESVLGMVATLVGLALASTAYRRVARS
jgi:hypothetical protein